MKDIIHRIKQKRKMMSRSSSLEKNTFIKLTPRDDIEIYPYEEAFSFVFSSDDLTNIAITGVYGAGKSSVMRSYEKAHPEKRFKYVSFAHFKSATASETNEKELAISLEGKIINHLVHQIPYRQIKNTNFKTEKRNHTITWALYSIVAVLLALLSVYLLRFDSWQRFAKQVSPEYPLYDAVNSTTSAHCRLAAGLLLVGGITACLFTIIYSIAGKMMFRKVSAKGIEIDLFANDNSSHFDKYMNEVVYLFKNTKVDGIVFDDIDRFDNLELFERLREINGIANLSKKRRGRPLRFFYLVRDDLFSDNKERTKFFDFIIPVIPYMDCYHSYKILSKRLNEASLIDLPDDVFLREISLYIDDPRLLNNIFNEFVIYEGHFGVIGLNVNKMLAVIAYKNVFPKDYSNLQRKMGVIYYIFSKKEEIRIRQKKELNAQKQNIKEEYDKECRRLEDQEAELEKERKNNKMSMIKAEFDSWEATDYKERKETIEKEKNKNEKQFNRGKNHIVEEIQKVDGDTISGLLSRDNKYFNVPYEKDELPDEEYMPVIKSRYFGLLKFLILRNYMDETYTDYMTQFTEYGISRNDQRFIMAVRDRSALPADYPLDHPSMIVNELDENDFHQYAVFNYQLYDYIFQYKLVQSRYIVDQIHKNKDAKAIIEYLHHGKQRNLFIHAIVQNWHELFEDITKDEGCSQDDKREICIGLLQECNKEEINKANVNSCLSDYISITQTFLQMTLSDERVRASLLNLHIKFANICVDNANEETLDFVYRNDMYEINEINIRHLLSSQYGLVDIMGKYSYLFGLLYANEDWPISKYMWGNLDIAMRKYLGFYSEEITDSSEVIVKVLNTMKDKKCCSNYIKRLHSSVTTLFDIDQAEYRHMLIKQGAVDFNFKNISQYFYSNGLNMYLLSYLNHSEEIPDLSVWNSEFKGDFLVRIIVCKDLKDNVREEIYRSLCQKQLDSVNLNRLPEDVVKRFIEDNCLKMNRKHLNAIRESFPQFLPLFIHNNIEAYQELPGELLSHKEFESLFKSKILTEGDKDVLIIKGYDPTA